MIAVVAGELAKASYFAAALKHYELAMELGGPTDSTLKNALSSFKLIPEISPWLKQQYSLLDPPQALEGSVRAQFEQASGWVREGLWDSAAAAFELLSADRLAGPAADYNKGLCRLWLGDEESTIPAFRRWIAREGPTTRAVDLEILCQLIDETTDKEPVEIVQLTWPLRDRAALNQILERDRAIVAGEKRHLDPTDEQSPQMNCFHWLDRPVSEERTGLSRQDIPTIQGDVLVGSDTVVLETHDDGRLNNLIDRFMALAGKSVPPAHPRTKVIGQLDRSEHAMAWRWYLPPGLPDEERRRLMDDQIAYLMTTVFPETPLTALGGRSPIQAARSGKSEVPLRAAVLIRELAGAHKGEKTDWMALRSRLSIQPEPPIDPETADIDAIPLGRLALVPVPRLDDDRLIKFYLRSHEFGLADLILQAAHEIVDRPQLRSSSKLDLRLLYSVLAQESQMRQDRSGALEMLQRGQTAMGSARRPEDSAFWDMMELQIRVSFDSPTEWVPELAAILERYRDNDQASAVVTTRLIDLGLLRLVSPEDRPDEVMIDPRLLQQLLSQYGPRITTSGGYLGVSATKGEIWTPQSAAPGSGLWTPGSEQQSSRTVEKRIILPG